MRLISGAERIEQPRTSKRPVTFGSTGRDAKRGGCFVNRKTCEEPQFYHFHTIGILRSEFFKALIDGKQFFGLGVCCQFHRTEVNPVLLAASLQTALISGSIHQNPPHRLGGGGEEVPTAVPVLRTLGVDKPNVSFMDEGSRLQGMIGRLIGHSSCSQFAQFVVNKRQQVFGRRRIARFDLLQDLCDV